MHNHSEQVVSIPMHQCKKCGKKRGGHPVYCLACEALANAVMEQALEQSAGQIIAENSIRLHKPD